MENKIAFRSRGRGYDKNDVNEYISSENIRFTRAEADFRKALDERDGELALLRDELGARTGELAECRSALAENDLINDRFKSSIEEANTRIAELEALVAHLEEVKDDNIYQGTGREVLVDAEIFEKAESYDRLCTQIDEILAYAKSEADKIINTTVENAKRYDRAHSASPDNIKKEISGRSNSIIDDIRKTLRSKIRG